MTPFTNAVLAGIFFGLWPLIMNRSGLNLITSSAVFYSVGLLVVMPFALRGASFAGGNGTVAAAAGLAGVLGLLAFNAMLAKTAPQQAAMMFMVMIVVQIAVPALSRTPAL
ncbi:MAG TPA: hypothetical protein VJC16_00700 [Candidatus Nanoarchaeia archaeon]|nr:hypothetical protein [Candidatus Nanoarchaeia archaeon]